MDRALAKALRLFSGGKNKYAIEYQEEPAAKKTEHSGLNCCTWYSRSGNGGERSRSVLVQGYAIPTRLAKCGTRR